MTIRTAARPLVSLALLGALSFSYGCDSGSDGGDSDGGSSTSGAEGSTGATTETPTTGTPTTDDSDGSSSSGEGSSGSTGEGDGSSSTGEALIGIADVAGTYIETYGPGPDEFQTHTVTATEWTTDFGGGAGMGVLTYEEVDDVARWVAGDDGAGTFSRYDWEIDGDGNLRYCTAVFGAETLEAAIAAPPSNRDDLDGTGCAEAFPWSLLVLEEEK